MFKRFLFYLKNLIFIALVLSFLISVFIFKINLDLMQYEQSINRTTTKDSLNELREMIQKSSLKVFTLEQEVRRLREKIATEEFYEKNKREYVFLGNANEKYSFIHCCTFQDENSNIFVAYDLYIQESSGYIDDLGTTSLFTLSSLDEINYIKVDERYYLGLKNPFLFITVNTKYRNLELVLMPVTWKNGSIYHRMLIDTGMVEPARFNNVIKSVKESDGFVTFVVEVGSDDTKEKTYTVSLKDNGEFEVNTDN